MELDFRRYDLLIAGSNARNTLYVLPSSKNKLQKVCIGVDTGVVQCFQLNKKGRVEEVFSTEATKHGVSAMCLGGTRDLKDNVLVAHGQSVRGLKKKGKQYFSFNTSLNEDIKHMFSQDTFLWTAGNNVVNMFESFNDTLFYMSTDKINHMTVAHMTNLSDGSSALGLTAGSALGPMSQSMGSTSGARISPAGMYPVLACQDRTVRLLRDDKVVGSCAVSGPANFVYDYTELEKNYSARLPGVKTDDSQIVYGTDNGIVGQLVVDQKSNMERGFSVGRDENLGCVNTITAVDLTADGVADLVVGRDNGVVDIYGFDLADAMDNTPDRIWHYELRESVTSIGEGHVSSMTLQELVVSTFSGKVIVFTQPQKESVLEVQGDGKDSDVTVYTEARIAEVMKDIEKLREKVDVSRGKYSKLSEQLIAVEPQFSLKTSFKLVREDAGYMLTIEAPMPLDVVMLQSAVPVIQLEMESKAIISKSPSEAKDGNAILATYRFQEDTNRLEVKIRTVEGQRGVLNAYVIPKMTPKCSQRVSFDIKPLSLHQKVPQEEIQPLLNTRALSTLNVTGSFAVAQVHSWMAQCLPEVYERVSTESVVLCYRSTFLDTVFVATYSKGSLRIQSDSVTAVSIAQEVISREATQRSIEISTQFDLNMESVPNFLALLRPKLQYQFNLKAKLALVQPLREIQTHENDIETFLSPQYAEILASADDLEREEKESPLHIDFLKGIVTDLYVDVCKIRGKRADAGLQSLLQILTPGGYDHEKLLALFIETM